VDTQSVLNAHAGLLREERAGRGFVAEVGFDTDSPSWEWEEVNLESLAAAMA
jgi:hypothetical protein